MSIIIACPGCGRKLTAPESAAGKQVRCPRAGCGSVADVPAFVDAAPTAVPKTRPTRPADDDEDHRPHRRRDEDDEDDRPRGRRRDDDEDEDRPRRRRPRYADDDDEYEHDHPRRRQRGSARGGGKTLTTVLIILGSLAALGGIGYGVYALVGKGGAFAKKAPPPAGWKQISYQEAGFKAYFPREPSAANIGGLFAGMGNLSGANVPESMFMYHTLDLGSSAPTVAVVVVRFRSALSSADRRRATDDMRREQGGRDPRSVRWLGESAEEIITSDGVARVAIVGKTMYVAKIGSNRGGRAKAEEEDGFFDNFELLR